MKEDLLQQKVQEYAEELVKNMNQQMFGDYKSEPKPVRTVAYRLRYWLAKKVLSLASKVSDDAYYDQFDY